MTKLVYQINEKACIEFFKKYPLVVKLMNDTKKRKNIRLSYCNFLQLKDANEKFLGGKPEFVKSQNFGEKTFFKYDWNGCTGWAELFQFYVTIFRKN